MAVNSRGQTRELQNHKRWKDRETSPERNRVWTEPKLNTNTLRKVPVVYYLSRNGQLEHPHFMEVSLSSPEGLYLRGDNILFSLFIFPITKQKNFFNFSFCEKRYVCFRCY